MAAVSMGSGAAKATAKPPSQRQLIAEVLRWNGHTIQKYGIKRDISAFLLSVPMQLFALDAFWWLFLEHFGSVDFHGMVERTRRGALVSESDVATYMGTGRGGAGSPRRPVKKADNDGKDHVAAAYQDRDTKLPMHVSSTRARLRTAEDVVRVGTPTLTKERLAGLTSVLGNETGVAVDSDDEASVASTQSLDYAPSEVSNGTSRSDLSAQSAATVDGLLRVTRFATTFPSLTKLPPEVRASVIAREQHQLFTRMATHYAKAVQTLAPRHFTIKDAVTRIMPDLIAQCLFAAFWKSIPYAVSLFDLQFQRDVASTVSLWVGGVVRTPNPRAWPVHHMMDTVYKRGPQHAHPPSSKLSAKKRKAGEAGGASKQGSTVGRVSSQATAAGSSAQGSMHTLKPKRSSVRLIEPDKKQHSTPQGQSLRSPQDSPRGANGRQPLHFTSDVASGGTGSASPTPSPSRRSSLRIPAKPAGASGKPGRPQPASGGAEATVPHPPRHGGGPSSNASPRTATLPTSSTAALASLSEEEEFMLTPDQRRERAVALEVAAMRQDLTRLTTTHTFSQVHYSRDTRGRADASNVKAPGRTANVFQVGPQKRTVQVIKADLDAKYREAAPWYGNPKVKTRVREDKGTAKFALANWSPLLHRFMLSNGADNHGRHDSIKWTV